MIYVKVNDELSHAGTPHEGGTPHSGRYPWGSGKRPFQRLGNNSIYKSWKKKDKKEKQTYKKASEMSNEELIEFNTRKGLERKYVDNVKRDKGSSKLEVASDIARTMDDASNRMKRNVDEMYREQHRQEKDKIDLSSISDEDLRRIVNRMNLEQQYRNLSPVVVTEGEKKTKKAVNAIGEMTSFAASTLQIALAIKKLRG